MDGLLWATIGSRQAAWIQKEGRSTALPEGLDDADFECIVEDGEGPSARHSLAKRLWGQTHQLWWAWETPPSLWSHREAYQPLEVVVEAWRRRRRASCLYWWNRQPWLWRRRRRQPNQVAEPDHPEPGGWGESAVARDQDSREEPRAVCEQPCWGWIKPKKSKCSESSKATIKEKPNSIGSLVSTEYERHPIRASQRISQVWNQRRRRRSHTLQPRQRQKFPRAAQGQQSSWRVLWVARQEEEENTILELPW